MCPCLTYCYVHCARRSPSVPLPPRPLATILPTDPLPNIHASFMLFMLFSLLQSSHAARRPAHHSRPCSQSDPFVPLFRSQTRPGTQSPPDPPLRSLFAPHAGRGLRYTRRCAHAPLPPFLPYLPLLTPPSRSWRATPTASPSHAHGPKPIPTNMPHCPHPVTRREGDPLARDGLPEARGSRAPPLPSLRRLAPSPIATGPFVSCAR